MLVLCLYPPPVSTSTQQPLLLASGGFIAGLTLGLSGLAGVVGSELRLLGFASWIALGWLWSVWYRSVRCLFVLFWGGLNAFPSSLGFVTEPTVALQAWTSTWNFQENQSSQALCVSAAWLVLILLFGLANPQLIRSSEPDGVHDPYGVALTSQAICNIHPPSNPVTGYGVWWLGVIGCMGVVMIWKSLKWTVRRICCVKKTALSQVQTDDLPAVHHPLPSGVQPLSRILFSLWRANLDVPIELYSEKTQQEYFGYLGLYLYRQEQAEDFSDKLWEHLFS